MSNGNLKFMAVCGLTRGLIGYGIFVTPAAACFGAGIGIIAVPVLLFIFAIMGGG